MFAVKIEIMEIIENKLKVKRTGVFFQAGNIDSKVNWFACHGYGQLGNNLIKEKLNWSPNRPLYEGLIKTYEWINKEVNKTKTND